MRYASINASWDSICYYTTKRLYHFVEESKIPFCYLSYYRLINKWNTSPNSPLDEILLLLFLTEKHNIFFYFPSNIRCVHICINKRDKLEDILEISPLVDLKLYPEQNSFVRKNVIKIMRGCFNWLNFRWK